MNTQLIKGYSPLLLLTCLSAKPMHGYAATQWISKHTKGAVHLKPGSLYPLLHSLEEKKLIRARWKESQSGPHKKIYTITRKGVQELAKQKKDLQSFHRYMRGALK